MKILIKTESVVLLENLQSELQYRPDWLACLTQADWIIKCVARHHPAPGGIMLSSLSGNETNKRIISCKKMRRNHGQLCIPFIIDNKFFDPH